MLLSGTGPLGTRQKHPEPSAVTTFLIRGVLQAGGAGASPPSSHTTWAQTQGAPPSVGKASWGGQASAAKTRAVSMQVRQTGNSNSSRLQEVLMICKHTFCAPPGSFVGLPGPRTSQSDHVRETGCVCRGDRGTMRSLGPALVSLEEGETRTQAGTEGGAREAAGTGRPSTRRAESLGRG